MTRHVIAIPAVMCLRCCRRGGLVIWRARVLCRGCQMTPEQVERMRVDVIEDEKAEP